IAEHVGVRRAPRTLLGEEIVEYALPVFGRETYFVQRDGELAGDRARVLIVRGGGAVGIVVVLIPVAHEEPVDVVALLAEQECGDGGVDTAGEANDDAGKARHGANCTRRQAYAASSGWVIGVRARCRRTTRR